MKAARSEDGSEGQKHLGLPERGRQKDPPERVGAEMRLGTYLRQAEKWGHLLSSTEPRMCVECQLEKSREEERPLRAPRCCTKDTVLWARPATGVVGRDPEPGWMRRFKRSGRQPEHRWGMQGKRQGSPWDTGQDSFYYFK